MNPGALTWTVHPARERPAVAFVVIAGVALISILGGRAMGADLAWTAWLFALLLFASVSSFFFPTTYELGDDMLIVRQWWRVERRALENVRRIELGERAALLSTSHRPTWVDRYRALLVRLEGAPDAARARLARLAASVSEASGG